MIRKSVDIVSLLEKAFTHTPSDKIEEIGTVIQVGDGIARVYGLTNAAYGDLVSFEGGNAGMILDLDEDFVSVVAFDNSIPIVEQEIARRDGDILRVPVGESLIGRVVDASGKSIDGGEPIKSESTRPAERLAPGIVERVPVCSPLETGITAIDCLIPIGKGQRELLIGNRSTGKTSIIVDTILHQKNKDVTCIYVSIGHKKSNAAKIIDTLERNGAMEYTTVVLASAHDSAMSQFIAPYTACAMGEHFMEQGKDVAVFYNDLSNHAVAYRELSLLLRRPPGREAYPGDIFYIHSRLLERACKLSPERGGGSLTAIPVVQTQDDDISAYIPTNLISITDGQIFLDVSLFNQGIRPAVNVGLSVSRVGGAAQTKAIKQMAGRMKLDLAQYESLLDFAQFGSELDKESQARLDHGRRAIEILKQGRYETHSFSDQVLFLYLLRERFLDQFKLEDVKEFATQFASYVSEMYPEIYEKISEDEALEDTVLEEIKEIAEEFSLTFPKV